MADEKKEVVVEGFGKVVLVRPSVGVSREADWIYSRVFNEAIRKGIPPVAILENRLRESGSWTPEQDKEIAQAREVYTRVSEQIRNEKDEAKRETLKSEWLDAKSKLFELNMAKNSLYEHSSERKSESRRLEYLVLNCSLKEDGKTRLWANEDEAYANLPVFNEVVAEYLAFISGISLDNLDTPPAPEIQDAPGIEPAPASPTA